MPVPHIPPLPFDAARLARALDALEEQGFRPPDEKARALLAGAFGNSPFLQRLALRETETLAAYFTRGPEALLDEANALALTNFADEAQAMADLRRAKRRAALVIALADIGGWELTRVTGALSDFGDACVKGVLRFLLARMAARHGLAEKDGARLETTTGLTI